jgi:hypothetical protein
MRARVHPLAARCLCRAGEGEVDLAPVVARPDDPTVDELVIHDRALMGEHQDWDAYAGEACPRS